MKKKDNNNQEQLTADIEQELNDAFADIMAEVNKSVSKIADCYNYEEGPGDLSWLGPYQGKRSKRPDTRICSHCGAEVHQAWVYEDGLAFYCSEECLLKHFTPNEWNSLVERAESPECLEPGLAYYMDYTGRRW